MSGPELAELIRVLKDEAFFQAAVQKAFWMGVLGATTCSIGAVTCAVLVRQDIKREWSDGLIAVLAGVCGLVFLLVAGLAACDVIWPEVAAIQSFVGH